MKMAECPDTYQIINLLGCGRFGEVYECMKTDTRELVAVKIVPWKVSWLGLREAKILERLRLVGFDNNNLVRFNGHSVYNGNVYLEFEMLHMTLQEYIKEYRWQMQLSEIQEVTKELLFALNALKRIGIVHTNIKPNNIMLVSQCLQPIKVKLIDFDLAIDAAKMHHGSVMQVSHYRAPEVMLGLQLSEAIDMWSLGCILAYMYIGHDLYSPLMCEHSKMRFIVNMLGQPDDHLLNTGIYTKVFFNMEEDSWSLKLRCSCSKNVLTNGDNESRNVMKINEILSARPQTTENEDSQAFLSLLKQMLIFDPNKRITPCEAMAHPFMTMKDFPSDSNKIEMPSTSFYRGGIGQLDCNSKPRAQTRRPSHVHLQEMNVSASADGHNPLVGTLWKNVKRIQGFILHSFFHLGQRIRHCPMRR